MIHPRTPTEPPPAPLPTRAKGSRQGNSAAKRVLAGCGLAALASIALTALLLWRVDAMAREALAQRTLAATETALQRFGIPEGEHAAILHPLQRFTGELREGKATLREAQAVSDALMDGVFFRMVPFAGFGARFLADPGTPDPDREHARRTLHKFLFAVRGDQVDPLTLQSLWDLILEEDEGGWHLKPSMTAEDLRMTLLLMADAAAGVDLKEAPPDTLDLRAAIEGVILEVRMRGTEPHDKAEGDEAGSRHEEEARRGTG